MSDVLNLDVSEYHCLPLDVRADIDAWCRRHGIDPNETAELRVSAKHVSARLLREQAAPCGDKWKRKRYEVRAPFPATATAALMELRAKLAADDSSGYFRKETA